MGGQRQHVHVEHVREPAELPDVLLPVRVVALLLPLGEVRREGEVREFGDRLDGEAAALAQHLEPPSVERRPRLVGPGLALRRLGYEADFAQNGSEVVAKVTAAAMAPEKGDGAYDIVFMDIHMPEMDGLEATRAIRQLAEERPRAPWPRIVAMTADAMQDDRQICLDAGMDDYLTKPLDFDALKRVLKQTARVLGKASLVSTEAPSESAPAQAPRAASVVDWSRLDELRSYDTPDGAVVREVVSSFSTQTVELQAAILRSAAAKDAQGLRESAHRLKGSASNGGAIAVTELAARIETAGREESLGALDPLLDAMRDALDETLAALNREAWHGGVQSPRTGEEDD